MKQTTLVVLLCSIALFFLAGCGNDTTAANRIISGKVYSKGLETNTAWSAVTITLEGDRIASLTTGEDGSYRFTVPNGNYRVTASLKGITFAPPSCQLTIDGADISGVDFVVQPAGATSVANTFSATGAMLYPRYGHTATLLSDGKVLVAGGHAKSDPRASAELYDPATGLWKETGKLAYARYYHTATLLKNGKVLVVGGHADKDPRASAELYDPATGTWTETGKLTYARYNHTATLLPNGKVLVAGGHTDKDPLASAELYDPATGTWAETWTMVYARYLHTATLLPDGKVLVTGGHSKTAPLATAELFNPATARWTETGRMDAHGTVNLYRHAATLLPDGTVLTSGGILKDTIGVEESMQATLLYDPATGTWPFTSKWWLRSHYDHTATLLPNDSAVLVAGGGGDEVPAQNNAQLLNLTTNTKSYTDITMMRERAKHTATLLANGKVLLAGGYDSKSVPDASAELFHPAH
jgi:hypothetical protein